MDSVGPTWRHDPAAAARYAVIYPRRTSEPPHWLRCEHMLSDSRCIKADGHAGEHEMSERT